MIKINIKIKKIARVFISLVLSFLVLTFIQLKFRSFKYGIDFIGGSVVEFQKLDNVHTLEGLFRKHNVQYGKEELINSTRFKISNSQNPESVFVLMQDLSQIMGQKIVKTATIDPSLSTEMCKKAIYALVFSIVAIFAYVYFMFGFQFAYIAVFAIGLNVYFLINIILFLQYEVSFSSITALLIILGYSINDTMVIYDRIRTNAKTGLLNIEENLHQSLASVLKRSIITSCLTLFSSLCLLTIHEYSIAEFAVVVSCGIVIGTFFSIFLVPSLLLVLRANLGIFVNVEKDAAHYNS